MTSSQPTADALPRTETAPLVWDLPVRIFHWGLLASIVAAFVTNKLGVKFFWAHAFAGYTALVLTAFRILWGFVGTRHALFSDFLRGPAAVLAYAKSLGRPDGPHYVGHNPLGAAMVLFLLAGVLAQAATGLFSNDEIFNTGPLAGYVGKELGLALTSFHRRFFYVLLGAIALHALAVAAHRIFRRENLVAAMISGRKPDAPAQEGIDGSRLWLAAPLVAALAALLWWVIAHAPHAAADGEF
jgi:cytochrome b